MARGRHNSVTRPGTGSSVPTGSSAPSRAPLSAPADDDVSFSGSDAHTAALLSAALGRESEPLFAQARRTIRALGAAGWLFELANQEAMWSVAGSSDYSCG